jgi:4,5-dihydroxyphthalate decarboxylase
MMAAYPGVKPLFDNNQEILDYVKKTGINPIMHVLSIRKEVVERHPDLPAKLTARFHGSARCRDPIHGRRGSRRLRKGTRRPR